LFLLSLTLTLIGLPAQARAAGEEQVCSFFGIEGRTFSRWRDLANQGSAPKPKEGYSFELLSLGLPEGIKLSGYRITANQEQRTPRALLVLLGNAMQTDRLLNIVTFFADQAFDVFLFDYRGYGKSEGEPRLKAIAQDQIRITDFIKSQGYQKLYLYGMSMGGIFAMSPHMPRTDFTAIAIDSSPAKFPWYAFCPTDYNPISNVPEDSSNILIISGDQDTVIPASDVKPLGEKVVENGGTYINRKDLRHPLMDSRKATDFRFGAVVEFFAGRE